MGKKKRREYQLPKASRKVGLPVDRNGRPIHVGDIVAFGDCEPFKVVSLTWCGGEDWLIGNEDDCGYSDNPNGATVIWSVGGKA